MSFEVQKQGLGKVATLVIPLRLGPHLFQGQTRLELILDRVPGQLFEIIIVDYGSSPRYRKHLLIAARRHRARVIRPRECSAQFSIARARNVGAMHAKTSVVVFHDVDFLGQHGDYQALANLIEARQVATRLSGFFIVPISFLTKGGSKRFLDRTSNKPVNISAQFLESITDYVAWNSSCLVIGRLFFLGLGGNDEEFDGHGAEDFEFYHRLNSTLNSVEHKERYYENRVVDPQGITFRSVFSQWSDSATQHGIHLVHLYHPRRKDTGYYSTSRRNFSKLRHKMLEFDKGHADGPPPLRDGSGKSRQLYIADQNADKKLLRFMLPLFDQVISGLQLRGGVHAAKATELEIIENAEGGNYSVVAVGRPNFGASDQREFILNSFPIEADRDKRALKFEIIALGDQKEIVLDWSGDSVAREIGEHDTKLDEVGHHPHGPQGLLRIAWTVCYRVSHPFASRRRMRIDREHSRISFDSVTQSWKTIFNRICRLIGNAKD